MYLELFNRVRFWLAGVRGVSAAAARDAEIEGLQDRLWRLAESEERYRSLVEAQLDAVVQRDRDGRITFANEGYARLLGTSGEGVLGSAATPRVVESGPAQIRADRAQLFDEAIETADGVRWFAWVETTIPGRRGTPETLRTGREVTGRVEVERTLGQARVRAEAASEAKSRFLATVSHEFRTPLNGILGMTELLLDTAVTPEQTTYLGAIKTSGEALLGLIDEILDFSKIEAGRIDLSAEPVDLEALIEGVVELLAPRAQDKGIEIAAFLARDVPRMVVGDRDRLRQVLVNLAGNAVKFTEAGGVGVLVEYAADGHLVLAVSDTGPGIPEDRMPALFEEFEQGDGSHSRRHDGTGLGLAITRRIIESMAGSIAVETMVGQGSTFCVRVPLPAIEPVEARAEPDLAGLRALVLASSAFEGPYLARRLREAGASVAEASTAADALAALELAPDLLIADRALGDSLVREVARSGRLAGVGRTLVLVSPFDRRGFSPEAAGFDGYLVKPVRARSLFDRLAGPALEAAASASPPALASPQPRPEPTRVLLAEDNDINALLAQRALEKLGAIVDRARDGHEAVALAESALTGMRPPYQLILMDVRMPGLDGLAATRRLRGTETALGRDPCRMIALTANTRFEDREAARAAGLDGFLPKPIDFAALAALLQDSPPSLARAS